MILTVTPGINLSTVSGPISKAQLNQLGQPTVGLLPGSVVKADTSFTSLRCTDGSFPFYELYNTAAPVDKKYGRLAVATNGEVRLERINDAYTVGTVLASWDTSNNTTLSGSLLVNGSIKNVQGFMGGASDASAWTIGAGSSIPGTGTGGAYVQLFGGTHPSWPGRLFFGTGTNTHGGFDASGNLGVGTLAPSARLHVVGGDVLLENNRKLVMPDASGGAAALITQSDNNWVFYGTGATGAGRVIATCFMRSDTSAFTFNVPLKIGSAGSEIKTVLTTVYTGPTRTLTAGATASNTITLTGVPNTSVCALTITPTPAAWVDDRIVISARLTGNPNEVKVVWYNPSAVSISLGGEQYRIEATIY